MRVLLAGANGMLGSAVVGEVCARRLADGAAGDTVLTALDLPEFDITDADDVCRTIEDAEPHVVINCAGYTDVDGAETHRDRAFAVNEAGPRNLAEAAHRTGARILHISTDFVFDGEKGEPYDEDDEPRPLSVYSESKLAGEEAVRGATDNHLIVRTSWLFGAGGRNFVRVILQKAKQGGRLRVVSDQVGCPTYATDLAAALLTAIERDVTGTYHLCNAGPTTWFELARTAVEMAGLTAEVDAIATHDWPRPARVPACSALSCEKAWRDAGIRLRPWREALEVFIRSDLGRPAAETAGGGTESVG